MQSTPSETERQIECFVESYDSGDGCSINKIEENFLENAENRNSSEETEDEFTFEDEKLLSEFEGGLIPANDAHEEIGGNDGNARNLMENEKQGSDRKKARRVRRKEKHTGKAFESSGMKSECIRVAETERRKNQIGESKNSDQIGGDQLKYTREELMDLRFANVVEQRSFWRDICASFGDAIAKEYADLIRTKNKNAFPLKSDTDTRGGTSGQNPSMELKNGEESDAANAIHSDPTACIRGRSHEDDSHAIQEEADHMDHESDDDDDDCDGGIQRLAFLVEGEPDFDSGPPEDGLEYLRRVRWEAARIPKVKVAKFDGSTKEQSVYMPQIAEIAKCEEHLLPEKHWEEAFLSDFLQLRRYLAQNDPFAMENLNPMTFKSNSQDDGTVIYQRPQHGSMTDSSSSSSSSSRSYPTLSLILSMDPVSRVSMLRKLVSSIETARRVSKKDCLWLFALCAAVDTPLQADTCASVRSLLRKCASLRAAKSIVDDELVMLNILATISGKVFGQSEG